MNGENVDFLESNAYITANDLVDGLLIREEGFVNKDKKPQYLFLLKEVYQHLNLSVIRQTERVLLKVDKAHRCVYAPSGYLKFSSIAVPNHQGKFAPLIVNENIDTDIVDLGASKKCGCDECDCDCEYCSNIKNYELITSTVSAQMPGGGFQDFTVTERKKVLRDGTYVREITQPVQIFANNIHTSTVLKTKTETLCKLDVKECGCIKNTPQNERLLFEACDSVSVAYDCGCPVRIPVPSGKYYKISDKGNRIHFPDDFPYDTVLLRYYSDRKTKELRIPYLAAKTVRLGIKVEQTTYTSPGSRENLSFISLFSAAKSDLAIDLANLKLSNFYAHLHPAIKVL